MAGYKGKLLRELLPNEPRTMALDPSSQEMSEQTLHVISSDLWRCA